VGETEEKEEDAKSRQDTFQLDKRVLAATRQAQLCGRSLLWHVIGCQFFALPMDLVLLAVWSRWRETMITKTIALICLFILHFII